MNLRQIYSAFLTCLACFLCGEVRNWDLNSWLEAALPQHPALSEAEAVVLASKWRSEERVIWEDPEIRFGVEKSLAWRDEAFVSVRLRIPNAYEEKALSDRERSRLDMAIAEQRGVVRIIREDLGRLYLETLAAQELLILAKNRVDAMQLAVRRGQELLQLRRFERLDLLPLEIDLADALVELSKLASTYAVAQARMLEYLPHDMRSEELSLQPVSIQFEGKPPSTSEIRRSVAACDPDLALCSAAVRAATAAVAADRARRIPFPTFIQGTWTSDDYRDRDEWEARIGVAVPFFSLAREPNPRDRAELLLAETSLHVRQKEIEALSIRLSEEYSSAQRNVEATKAAIHPILDKLRAVLEKTPVGILPNRQVALIDDQYRLQRDLVRAELESSLAAWALHTALMDVR